MRAWWALVLVAACTPALPDGRILCNASEPRCPDDFGCVDGVCRSLDGGHLPRLDGSSDAGGSDAGPPSCEPGLFARNGVCRHPCEDPAHGACPAGTICVPGRGCLQRPCSTSGCDEGRICGVEDTCFEACATECDAFGSTCNGEYCVASLAGCWPLVPSEDVRTDDCPLVGPFDLGAAPGELCCRWSTESNAMPEPLVELGPDVVTVELMGRPSGAAPDLYALSLLKGLRVGSASDLARQIEVVLDAPIVADTGTPFGVTLELRVRLTGGGQLAAVHVWSAASSVGAGEPGFVLTSFMEDTPPAITQVPLVHGRAPAPLSRSLPDALAALGVDEASVEGVDFALTVWSLGARVDVGIRTFSITPL